MRRNGKLFDGSNSVFETQQLLLNWNIAGNALWLTHFTPTRLDHLRFVNLLLKTFCALDICCAFVRTYPAYIPGVLGSYYNETLRVCQLCIPKTDSPILDINRKLHTFEIGPFTFRITAEGEYAGFPDYSIYEITHETSTIS